MENTWKETNKYFFRKKVKYKNSNPTIGQINAVTLICKKLGIKIEELGLKYTREGYAKFIDLHAVEFLELKKEFTINRKNGVYKP